MRRTTKKVDAGAAWYGRLVPTANSPKNEAQPTTPIDYAKDLKVPVIGLYGELDTGIPLEGVQKMQDELKKGKSKSEIIVFKDAKHGFLADYRESYNKEAGEEAWQKMPRVAKEKRCDVNDLLTAKYSKETTKRKLSKFYLSYLSSILCVSQAKS